MAPQTPRVIVLAGSKGGVGKSTLAAALAVRAMADGGRIALADWEPQGSLTVWHKLRGKPENPALVVASGDRIDASTLKASGARWTFVDTPPQPMAVIERAIEACDLCIIPVRTGLFDVVAIRAVVGLCQEHERPFLFALNATSPGEAGWDRLIKSTIAILKKHGPVAPRSIRHRACWVSALNAGKTGAEVADSAAEAKAAADDINALWQAVKRASTKARVAA